MEDDIKEKDLYVINKFVMANSVEEALEKEKEAKITEVFIEGDWRKHKIERVINKQDNVGF